MAAGRMPRQHEPLRIAAAVARGIDDEEAEVPHAVGQQVRRDVADRGQPIVGVEPPDVPAARPRPVRRRQLAQVIEAVSGMTWEQFITTRIFKPVRIALLTVSDTRRWSLMS